MLITKKMERIHLKIMLFKSRKIQNHYQKMRKSQQLLKKD